MFKAHRHRHVTAALLLALGAPVALAADTKANEGITSKAPVVTARPQVPQFPAYVKARGDRLWKEASPAVKAWVKQVAPGIAKGSGDPGALARSAAQARWPDLHVAGAADALTLLVLCEVATDLARMADERDSLAEQGQAQQLKLKLIMERMAKADSAARSALTKFSETASGIIANMK